MLHIKVYFQVLGSNMWKYDISNLFIYELVLPKTCKHTSIWKIE